MQFFDTLLAPAKEYSISVGLVLVLAGATLFVFLPRELVFHGLSVARDYMPLWATIVLFFVFRERWMEYVQTKTFLALDRILLEIKLPEEITQSPLAMETALNAFFYTGEPDTPYKKYVMGVTRSQFSLEIVSFEGSVRFFIHTRRSNRATVEAQLYSQYPTIEIHEIPDYMPLIPYDIKKMKLYGIYQKLQKPDPYPIKTYVDFGLDKETKEEFKVDPINAILEQFGALGEGEYGLMQILIRSHQAERHAPGSWFKKEDWKAEAKREIEAILSKVNKPKDSVISFRMFTEGEKSTMEALERNTSKKPFDVGIRIIYMAEIDKYRKDRQGTLPTMMRTFEDHGSNGFKPIFLGSTYPWEDPFQWRENARKREIYEGYRLRSYFTAPNESHHSFVLSSEELATVFHFPGRVAQTPTLGRITSHKEEAPPNLPR